MSLPLSLAPLSECTRCAAKELSFPALQNAPKGPRPCRLILFNLRETPLQTTRSSVDCTTVVGLSDSNSVVRYSQSSSILIVTPLLYGSTIPSEKR